MSEPTKKPQELEDAVKGSQSSLEGSNKGQKTPETGQNKGCACSGGSCDDNKEPCADKEGCACQKELEVEVGKAETGQDSVAENTVKTDAENVEGIAEEYIDPISEEYLIERENLIAPQWWLFYELEPFRDKITNMSLGW